MSEMRRSLAVWVFGVSALLASPAWSDAMLMPVMADVKGARDAQWDGDSTTSDGLQIFEPAQRAVILHNGKEEILCLSTELSASRAASVLEVVPFPAEPAVSLGEFETMQAAERLLLKLAPPWVLGVPGDPATLGRGGMAVSAQSEAELIERSAQITFHEKLGAHDLSVVKVVDREYFVKWVDKFLIGRGVEKAEIRPEYLRIVDSYLRRGFGWFVFDTLRLDDSVRSREPIEYRFICDHIYYPLETSTLQQGRTKVDLLLITKEGKLLSEPVPPFRKVVSARAPRSEIHVVSKEWARFMEDWDLEMQMYTAEDELANLSQDLLLAFR